MNAQEYRERHAAVTRLCATALRTKKPVTIPADLSGAFATAGEATTYTPTKIRNYINRVLTAVGRYNPAWGIATASNDAALADAIEAELTYTPTGNGFGSAFTSDALSRCAGKARSDADTSFVDGRRARTRKPTISAEDKVWLRANIGADWFGATARPTLYASKPALMPLRHTRPSRHESSSAQWSWPQRSPYQRTCNPLSMICEHEARRKPKYRQSSVHSLESAR